MKRSLEGSLGGFIVHLANFVHLTTPASVFAFEGPGAITMNLPLFAADHRLKCKRRQSHSRGARGATRKWLVPSSPAVNKLMPANADVVWIVYPASRAEEGA